MSNYYKYRDVKVMIAHKLMAMEGWEVYGYKADESDSMVDYYSPAYWDGVAAKNGYIFCVDVYKAAEPQEIRKYNYDNLEYDKNIADKISKLKEMTVARGASEAEEESAKKAIEQLQRKAVELTENQNKYIVTDIIPGHQANPPKCNWHIEKDGIIIAKGNGILKYASIDNYYSYPSYAEAMRKFKEDKEMYTKEYKESILNEGYYYSEAEAEKAADSHIKSMEKDCKLISQFETFIGKIDTICGGLIGDENGFIYEKVIKTEYKTELKPVESAGEIKNGQCFILKTNFNYGRSEGFVYRIHETEENGKKYYHGYKLNRKFTKECVGMANSNNYWFIGTDEHNYITKWIEKGAIAWCELKEVKTPYEVEKIVKKVLKPKKNKCKKTAQKADKSANEEKNENNNTSKIDFSIEESQHTKTGELIWLVKIKNNLSREDFQKIKKQFAALKGYYSTFTHSFIFKYNPTENLVF